MAVPSIRTLDWLLDELLRLPEDGVDLSSCPPSTAACHAGQVVGAALYDVLVVARPAVPAAAHAGRRLRLLLRAAGLAAVLGAYVWLRHALTEGQQLVKVFRKVSPSLLPAPAAGSLQGIEEQCRDRLAVRRSPVRQCQLQLRWFSVMMKACIVD